MMNIVDYYAPDIDSTGLVLYMVKHRIPIEEVIYVNNGAEETDGMHYIKNVLIPYLKKHGVRFKSVKTDSIYDWYFSKKKIPFRINRDCTKMFKSDPFRQYLEQSYGEKHLNVYCGFTSEEKGRDQMRTWKTYLYKYPLIDNNIDRDSLKLLFDEASLPLPKRAGCYFCPFKSQREWLMTYLKEPERFQKAKALEERNAGYPKHTLVKERSLAWFEENAQMIMEKVKKRHYRRKF